MSVFDLDGTLTRRDTFRACLLGYLRRRPERWRRLWRAPVDLALYGGGRRDNSWLKRRGLRAAFGGLTRAELELWSQAFIERLLVEGLRPEGLREIARRRAAGDWLVLATASIDLYAEPLAERLGLDLVVCTRLAWSAQDRFTGDLDGPNCYGEAKLALVRARLAAAGIDGPLTFYSDHHSDLPLLRAAERPFAVCPTPRLRSAAEQLAIPILDWR